MAQRRARVQSSAPAVSRLRSQAATAGLARSDPRWSALGPRVTLAAALDFLGGNR